MNTLTSAEPATRTRPFIRKVVVAMKHQPIKITPLPEPLPENARIYTAIVAGGAAILLMILAEMKFFGT